MIVARQFVFSLRCVAALTAAVPSLGTALAQAQAYPSKTIHFIVPFGAGTTTDQAARFIAQRITLATNEPVVVDNKSGANGFIALQYALQQPADGYTVVFGTNTTHAANLALFKKVPYDPVKDFAPVTGIIAGGVVLAVAPSSPARNVQDLIGLARKNPGRMTFGSGNSSSRAGGEVMRDLAKLDIVHVPYKTVPAAITDLMAGRIDMVFADGPAIMPLVRAGKLRALGTSTRTRMAGYEDIPTIAEQGVPGYEVSGWIAMFVPAGTPGDVIARLNGLVVSIMKSEEANKFFGQNAWRPIPGTPAELAAFQRSEIERWALLVKSAGIEPE